MAGGGLFHLVMMVEQGFVLHVEGVIGDSMLTFAYGEYGRGPRVIEHMVTLLPVPGVTLERNQ